MRRDSYKTRKAWDEPAHAHFLTYSCYRRLPLLTKDRTRQWVVDALDSTRSEQHFELWAYVIMPEHVHLVLHPRQPRYQMRRILAAIKRPVSILARDFLTTRGQTTWLHRLSVQYPSRSVFRFWQPGGGYDNNIFRERTLAEVIDYIHANPVRRGLAQHPGDWIWSSARFYDGIKDVPIKMDPIEI